MSAPRRANVFGHNVGTGLSRHIAVVTDCLHEAGYEVFHRDIPQRRRGARLAAHTRRWWSAAHRFDVNLFLQELVPSWFHRARTNVLLPNQEWFDPRELRLLGAVDHIVCTSQHAQDLFSWRGPNVVSFGFTSLDRLLPNSGKSPTPRILHVAGRSPYKGTAVLIDLWRRHPEWPILTIVHANDVLEPVRMANVDQRIGHIEDSELQRLQNDAWLHVYPTEAEAFGHGLCEGLSVGALVLTTDAPPMNELIRPDRGILVPYKRQERLNLGYRFFVDPGALERALAIIVSNGPDKYASVMSEGRTWFVRNNARVRRELTDFFAFIK